MNGKDMRHHPMTGGSTFEHNGVTYVSVPDTHSSSVDSCAKCAFGADNTEAGLSNSDKFLLCDSNQCAEKLSSIHFEVKK